MKQVSDKQAELASKVEEIAQAGLNIERLESNNSSLVEELEGTKREN